MLQLLKQFIPRSAKIMYKTNRSMCLFAAIFGRISHFYINYFRRRSICLQVLCTTQATYYLFGGIIRLQGALVVYNPPHSLNFPHTLTCLKTSKHKKFRKFLGYQFGKKGYNSVLNILTFPCYLRFASLIELRKHIIQAQIEQESINTMIYISIIFIHEYL